MFRILLAISLILGVSHEILSQNEQDAYRFSNYNLTGSARYNAMGGAFTSLGGDASAIHINPAGLGVIRKAEVSISPYLRFTESETYHYGQRANDVGANARFGNTAIILAASTQKNSRWKQSNFGITFSKLADFNSNVLIEGNNYESSQLDVFKFDIENGIFNTYGSDLAWQTLLVDTTTINGPLEYYSQIPNYNQKQSLSITSKGDIRETLFSYGANFDDMLYIGASVGLIRLRYENISQYTETVSDTDSSTFLDDYSITNTLNSDGNGIRASLGVIYRPVSYLRLGASYQTSSSIAITDSYTSAAVANYEGGNSIPSVPAPGLFDYRLRTPSRLNTGVAFVFKKYGLLSIDYQRSDFSKSRLTSRPSSFYSFDLENQNIADFYKVQQVVRIGAESRYGKFSFRLGYSHTSNALINNSLNNLSSASVSGGVGYRVKHFYADLGVATTKSKQRAYIYDPAFVRASLVHYSELILSTTIGLRF